MLAFRHTWLLRESSMALFRIPRVAEEIFDDFVAAGSAVLRLYEVLDSLS